MVLLIAGDLVRSLVPRGFDRRLKLLSFVLFMNDFGRTLVTVYLPLYYLELNASPLFIGIGITISSGVCPLSGGRWSPRGHLGPQEVHGTEHGCPRRVLGHAEPLCHPRPFLRPYPRPLHLIRTLH